MNIKHHVHLLTDNIFDYKFTCRKRVVSTVFLLDLCRQVTCVACEDKTVSMFDTRGKRLLPPLMLGSQVSIMKCAGQHVMAVTSRGYLYIWSVWSCVFVGESCVNVFLWWKLCECSFLWWKLCECVFLWWKLGVFVVKAV